MDGTETCDSVENGANTPNEGNDQHDNLKNLWFAHEHFPSLTRLISFAANNFE